MVKRVEDCIGVGEEEADSLIENIKPLFAEIKNLFNTIRSIHIIKVFEKDKEIELLRELLKEKTK